MRQYATSAIQTLVSLSITAAIGHARAADSPETFTVRSHAQDRSEVIRFACTHAKGGTLECDVSSITVSYYDWGATPLLQRETRRCHVYSFKSKSQTFEPAGLGRWRRLEVGLCGATIQTEIITNDGAVTVRDTTLQNPGANDNICRVWGPAGTTKLYSPVSSLDTTQRECSSIVIDP